MNTHGQQQNCSVLHVTAAGEWIINAPLSTNVSHPFEYNLLTLKTYILTSKHEVTKSNTVYCVILHLNHKYINNQKKN